MADSDVDGQSVSVVAFELGVQELWLSYLRRKSRTSGQQRLGKGLKTELAIAPIACPWAWYWL